MNKGERSSTPLVVYTALMAATVLLYWPQEGRESSREHSGDHAQEACLGACRHHLLETSLSVWGPRRLSHYGLFSPVLWLGALRSQGVTQSPNVSGSNTA